MVLTKCPIQNGTELWTPGDEYNKVWREGSPKLLKTKLTEQFGTPLPRGRLIILVTRLPEFSAILPSSVVIEIGIRSLGTLFRLQSSLVMSGITLYLGIHIYLAEWSCTEDI